MNINNKDTVPILASEGEQIASNPALELMGRDLIPAYNKIAIKMKQEGSMKPQQYANGTTKREGVQLPMPPKKHHLKKKDEKEAKGDPDQAMEAVEGFAYGTRLPAGVQRIGNSYSQSGFVPRPVQDIISQPSGHPLPQGVQRTGNSYTDGNSGTFTARRSPFANGGDETDAWGYADGTTGVEGVQRKGNSFSKSRFKQSDGRPDSYKYQLPSDGTEQAQANDEALATNETDPYEAMQGKVRKLRGMVGAYAEGTKDESGLRPLSPPSLVDMVKMAIQGGDDEPQPKPLKSRPGDGAPTLEQSKKNYELQNGIQSFANGVTDEEGIKPKPASVSQLPAPYQLGNGAMDLQGKPTNTLNITDGAGGNGMVQFADNRALTTPQLTSLSSQIAYNTGNRDKYNANAAAYKVEQADKDAAARRAGLEQQALTAPDPTTMGIGDYIATRHRQKAAQQLLEVGQGQQKIDADIAQNEGATKAATQKSMLDYQTDQDKLALEREKQDTPIVQNVKEYNRFGQVIGENPMPLNRKTGEQLPPGNQTKFLDTLKKINAAGNLTAEQKLKAINELHQAHYGN